MTNKHQITNGKASGHIRKECICVWNSVVI